MEAKLIVEGREFLIEIQGPELQKLLQSKKKKTGYEIADEKNSKYWFVDSDGTLNGYETYEHDEVDSVYYEEANYYSDKTVAENNARADKLMRQLRRFAVKHREMELNWGDNDQRKYCICYDHVYHNLTTCYHINREYVSAVWFDSESIVKLAIEAYRDELIWYFTEYKDSL